MDERLQVLELANRLLDEPNADPDDDLRALSRQLVRRTEELGYVYRCITGGYRQGVFDFSILTRRAFDWTGLEWPKVPVNSLSDSASAEQEP